MITGILILCVLFASCGIEDYYYLEPVPERNITTQLVSDATVNIPSIDKNSFPYAVGYRIYYRIYLSRELTSSPDNLRSINPSLSSDSNYFSNYTDISNSTVVTTSSTFSGRGYYEADYEIGLSGGILRIIFPDTNAIDDNPRVNINNGGYESLRRSREISSTEIAISPNFVNTKELNSNANAVSARNADVSSIQNLEPLHAYASMYIVAIGYNQQTFSRIFSKPTFISVFKLPNTY
jgi:hypothetical protein